MDSKISLKAEFSSWEYYRIWTNE